MLRTEPSLTGTTLLESLLDHYPEHYDQSVLRTLQRRVKQWLALEAPDKDIVFRQEAVIAVQGFSDFSHPNDPVLIDGQPFAHLLYQFRLAFSGWRSVTVVQGGESFVALSKGLQRSLQQAGGSPEEHRLSQQLRLRGDNNFRSADQYQAFIDKVAQQLKRRVRKRFMEEQQALQPLPDGGVPDYQTLTLKVWRRSAQEENRQPQRLAQPGGPQCQRSSHLCRAQPKRGRDQLHEITTHTGS